MNNETKVREIKAHNVATDIIAFHMEGKIFSELNDTERLEVLSDKVVELKKKFTSKPFAQLVAKRMGWIMDDYVQERGLCPDCFKETSYQVTSRQTYWQPEEGKRICDSCGWSESM